MNIHEHTCPAYRPPSLNMFKPAHMYRIHVSSLFTRAYRYAIHVSSLFTRAYRYCVPVRNTGTQYMLQLCLHVRTGTQYRYCIPVRNTGIAYRYARVNIVLGTTYSVYPRLIAKLVEQSSTLPWHVLDFRYVAPFPRYGSLLVNFHLRKSTAAF